MRSDLGRAFGARRRPRLSIYGWGVFTIALCGAASWLVAPSLDRPWGRLGGDSVENPAAIRPSPRGDTPIVRTPDVGAEARTSGADRASRLSTRKARGSTETVPDPRPEPLVRTRPLSEWLGEVAVQAGRALVLDPAIDLALAEAAGSVAGEFPWRRRLEAYARVAGVAVAVDDAVIEVFSRESSDSGALSEPGAEVGSTDGPPSEDSLPSVHVVPLIHRSAAEVADTLAAALPRAQVSVAADVAADRVLVAGDAIDAEDLGRWVAALDRPLARIAVDARIVEVTRSARSELGIDWSAGDDVVAAVSFPPESVAGGVATLTLTGDSPSFEARLSALEAAGRVRVVSRPRVVVVEGGEASVESVRVLRVRLPSSGTVVGDEVVTDGGTGQATEEIPVGVRLAVRPTLDGSGRIRLRVRAESSSLGEPLPPDDIPEEFSRTVEAELTLADGETAVLGGLVRDDERSGDRGVPGLHRVPGLGRLFGRRSDARESEELVVFVTPRVQKDEAPLEAGE